MRYRIVLSYNGAGFNGWQIQPSAPSIQGALEKALSTLLRHPIQLTGAGRTDTGVNALGYTAHFETPDEIHRNDLAYKLNAILPAEICVISLSKCADDFHARFNASRREYTYFLHRVKDPFVSSFSYLCAYPELDFEKMNEAARVLPGRHDFSCFEKSGGNARTSVCTVFEAFWKHYTPNISAFGMGLDSPDAPKTTPGAPVAPGQSNPDGNCRYWYFRISADRFLRNMVRAVVGSLVEVGRGKRSIDDFAALVREAPEDGRIQEADGKRRTLRCEAGESVPGHALFLSGIEYPSPPAGMAPGLSGMDFPELSSSVIIGQESK